MNKIMTIIGYFSVSFILGFIFTYIDSKFGFNFLQNFLGNQLLSIIITMISFNIASITFLIGNLINIENRENKEIFKGTRKELKDNIYMMIFIFITILLLLILGDQEKNYDFFYKTLIISLFFIEIFCVIEIFNIIIKYNKRSI